MQRLILTLCALALAFGVPFPASAKDDDAEKWDVTEPHSATTTLEYTATEGTWICVDVSPDGNTLAFDFLGHLYTMPIAGGAATALTEGHSWNSFPRYSPAGTQLLFTSDRSGSEDLWTLDLASGEFKNISDMKLPVFQGTWSQDGRHVYGTGLNMKVRKPVYRFNLHGTKQEIIGADARSSSVLFLESPVDDRVFFEQQGGGYPRTGHTIKSYNRLTAEITTEIRRPGGACNPALSPDGKHIAYVHRDDKNNQLIVRDLATGSERVLVSGLDRARVESGYVYGVYPNMDWTPDGTRIVFTMQGGIHAVTVASGAVAQIPFEVPVAREVEKTIRFPLKIPQGETTTRVHRWGQPADGGILFEALGDLWLLRDGETVNLTDTPEHETNPIYDAASRTIYAARWDDETWGSVVALSMAGGQDRVLTTVPSQYGSLALSRDGQWLAYVRGDESMHLGTHLERQEDFELHVLDTESGHEEKVTDIHWTWNRYAKRPPTVLFDPEDEYLYFTEYVENSLTLKRIRPDGLDERTLVEFPNATRAVISPDMNWIAFREYHRTFVTPFEYAGKPVKVSAEDGEGFTQRVDAALDGDFTEWNAGSSGLYWTRGKHFFTKSLEAILAGEGEPAQTDLSLEYAIDTPRTKIAFTSVTVFTMNNDLEVIENATILVEGNRIKAVGTDVTVPADATVYDLPGATVMPGMFDAHGHYGSPISALNVIEQRHYGLIANLAYGVTTMYDVYGTTQKDFWISDMLQAGKMDGPRIYSVGDPIFVTKYRTKMYRPINSLDDALELARFNQDHGATGLKDYSNHTRAARQQLAEACREQGLNLISESFGTPAMNYTQLLDGFTGLEHTTGLTPVYDDVMRLFGATEVGMTPTLIVVYNGPSGEQYFYQTERTWEDEKLLRFFRGDELWRLRRPTFHWDDDWYHPEMASELRRMHQNGVLLQMGAHGQMMGLGAHWEMELFVHGGFTPLEAIQIATINGFKHHGLDAELGSIEVGKLADLVVMERDPREDIRNTRSILYVMKNGVVYGGSDGAEVYPDPGEYKPFYFMTDR